MDLILVKNIIFFYFHEIYGHYIWLCNIGFGNLEGDLFEQKVWKS